MTYYENLQIYLAEGHLYAKNSPHVQHGHRISYEDIITRRGTEFFTPCDSNVNDFVPFYFSPSTGMAYAVYKQRVPLRAPDGQVLRMANMEDIAYIVVTPQTLFASGRTCWFTNIACNSGVPPTYENQPILLDSHVEWALFDDAPRMGSIPEIGYEGVCKYQQDRDAPVEHQQRGKKRMAEFMVKNLLRTDEISCIILPNPNHLGEVQAWIETSGTAIPVFVKPGCYF